MLDLLLVAAIGFFGSFGHCVGMCGPLAVAFALSDRGKGQWWQQLRFHSLLNLGRICSYVLVGSAIGAVGSVLIAGGQMAGLGSVLRRVMALLTGSLLVWYGLWQINPTLLPSLPYLHPLLSKHLHDRLNRSMQQLSQRDRCWTPALLGMAWGLIPCGFLYAAQIKAAETGNVWQGAATMLAFGVGTLPAMVGVGLSVSHLGGDRRSQLFRLGGWLTLAVGLLTLLRTGSTMADYTGHGAIALLVLALIARPLNRWWPALMDYRRALGVGAFVLSAVHALHVMEHSWQWNVRAIGFMLPAHQIAIWLGVAAFACLLPAALTSFDRAQKVLGPAWRRIHLLAVPALILAAAHAIAIGSRFLGTSQVGWLNWLMAIGLIACVCGVLLLRSDRLRSELSVEKHDVTSLQTK
ncbi:sulfite exporter TauE/SafE family protein [Synechococcus sp. PCC 7336]|uniref:urease accessory protein UreH domain-containing protein n=1 Tax=Synechococcus sp. PCC 7336 TaxID=195250 RepID=UPI00034B5A94|nr:sulfite exporter TauE/SafE family protein [Synechococcus sp. PCC 7336]